MAGAFKFNEVNSEDIPNQDHGPNRPKIEPLSIRQLNDILAMVFDDSDFVLRNGYLKKGEPLAICGAPSVGKSRIVLQLIIAIITGRDFLGRWSTNGKAARFLLLQTENTCRRLKSDLHAMCKALSPQERQLVHDNLFIHTIENSDDSFVHLRHVRNQQRIENTMDLYNPDIVVFDVLRDFATDDLNADHAMQETLALIGRLARKKNPLCIPVIVHHGRTGRSGAASATGYDRGSFARNSKVLNSWVRAQVNIAPYQGDDNTVLVVSSGKCNNAEEFKTFAVRLNTNTMSYEYDESIDDIDLDEWKDHVGGNGTSSKKKKKKTDDELKTVIFDLVPDPGTILKNSLISKANAARHRLTENQSIARRIDRGKEAFRTQIKTLPNLRPDTYFSLRTDPVLIATTRLEIPPRQS
jgi:AAA domain